MANLQPLLPNQTPRKIPQSVFAPIAEAPPVADLSGMAPGPNPLGTIASIAPPPLATVGLDPRAALAQKNSDDLANRASADSADLFKRSHPVKPTTTLGKIGHVAANIGNVLGDIFAPSTMALIPGTQLNNEVAMNRDRADLDQVSNLQNEDAQRRREDALTAQAQARTNAIENPPAVGWKPLFGGNGQVVTAPNGNIVEVDKQGNLRATALPEGAAVAPKMAGGTHTGVLFNKNYPYGWTDPSGHQYTVSDPNLPEQGKMAIGDALAAYLKTKGDGQGSKISGLSLYSLTRLMQMGYADNPETLKAVGEFAKAAGINLSDQTIKLLSEVPQDQPLSPFNGNPIGTKMPSAPTGSTKTASQNALKFTVEYPRIRDEVNDAASDLGPVEGRAVMGFLLGTVGSTGNPQADRKLSKLRTDLAFVGSNAAKFHINSVEQAKLFDELAASGRNTAPAIQGFLDSVYQWAKTSANQIRGHGEGNPAEPHSGNASGGTVRLQAPDGSIKAVPASDAQHYIKLGAKEVK